MQYPPNQPPFQQQPNTYYPSMIPPPPPPRPPKKKPNPWLIISIIIGGLIIIGTLDTINKSTSQQTDTTPTVAVVATDTPIDTPVPTDTPAPANTPEPQAVYNWHGKGTQKTNEFSMQGTWHVNWYCLGSSYDPAEDANQYLTINLYNADTGKILQTWQHNCGTEHYDETVKYSGNFLIEGIVTKQAIEYHISILQ